MNKVYTDIISFELTDDIKQQHLLHVTGKIIKNWMSKKAAKDSEKEMMNIPNLGDWLRCYKEEPFNSQNLQQVGSFK